MAASSPHPSERSPEPRRRDGAGVVLTAVTGVVLLVGVLVIRSTRSDHPTPPPATEQEVVATPTKDEPPRPEVMIAWPKNRGETLR